MLAAGHLSPHRRLVPQSHVACDESAAQFQICYHPAHADRCTCQPCHHHVARRRALRAASHASGGVLTDDDQTNSLCCRHDWHSRWASPHHVAMTEPPTAEQIDEAIHRAADAARALTRYPNRITMLPTPP